MFKYFMENLSELPVLLVILLSGIWFILRQYYTWRLKLKEITFENITSTKVKELKAFYRSYIELETTLRKLFEATAQNDIEDQTELRKVLHNNWLDFRLHLLFIRNFLSSKVLVQLDELSEELNEINLQMDLYYIDNKLNSMSIDTLRRLRRIRDEVFPKVLPAILTELEKKLRRDLEIK